MDQTKSIKLQKKRLESAEERRARLDKNNEKARAKSRTETEQKKRFYLMSLTTGYKNKICSYHNNNNIYMILD